MHLDVAINHLDLASKSPHSVNRMTDLQFLKAQLNILKLHHITDNLGAGQSLTRALANQVTANHIRASLKQFVVHNSFFASSLTWYHHFVCLISRAEMR